MIIFKPILENPYGLGRQIKETQALDYNLFIVGHPLLQ